MKTLYFEGAGWAGADSSKATNVGNCRIRTAFTNNEGKQIYLELGSISNYDKKHKNKVLNYNLFVDYCFYIAGGSDDCNTNRLQFDKKVFKYTEYNKESITKWINGNLNCGFDTIEVLNECYCVFGEHNKYNFMEEITA